MRPCGSRTDVRRVRTIVLASLGILAVALVWLAFDMVRRDRSNTALAVAIYNNDSKGVEAALASGADPNYNMVDLQHTIEQKIYDATHPSEEHVPLFGTMNSALLSASAHLRDLPDTDLQGADQDGIGPTQSNIKILSALVRSGANVNATDYEGTTALMCAAGSGRLDTMQLLLDHAADTGAKDNKRYTALMWAASRNKPAAIQLLLSKESNLDQADSDRGEAVKVAQTKHNRAAIDALSGGRARRPAAILNRER